MAKGVMALIPASVAKIWTKENAGSSLEVGNDRKNEFKDPKNGP
jgi:hypothetical protein